MIALKNMLKEKNFLHKQSQQKNRKPIYKGYNFNDYTNLWSLVKKIFEGKLSIKEARKQQNAIEKKGLIGLIPLVLEEK